MTKSSGREGSSVYPRKIGDVALGRGVPASNPEIGPGYVDYGSFTDVEASKMMRMLSLSSPDEIEKKITGLKTRAKIAGGKVAEMKAAKEKAKLDGQLTYERRERMNWNGRQRVLRETRADERERNQARLRRMNEYNRRERIPSLREPVKTPGSESSNFKANKKAVEKSDNNFVRLLSSREKGGLA